VGLGMGPLGLGWLVGTSPLVVLKKSVECPTLGDSSLRALDAPSTDTSLYPISLTEIKKKNDNPLEYCDIFIEFLWFFFLDIGYEYKWAKKKDFILWRLR